MNSKKMFLGILMSMLVLTLVSGCGEKKDDKKQTNQPTQPVPQETDNSKIADKVVGDFSFTDAKVVFENNETHLVSLMTNKTESNKYVGTVKLHLKDKNGNEVFVFTIELKRELAANEVISLGATYTEDLTRTTQIDYELVNE